MKIDSIIPVAASIPCNYKISAFYFFTKRVHIVYSNEFSKETRPYY